MGTRMIFLLILYFIISQAMAQQSISPMPDYLQPESKTVENDSPPSDFEKELFEVDPLSEEEDEDPREEKAMKSRNLSSLGESPAKYQENGKEAHSSKTSDSLIDEIINQEDFIQTTNQQPEKESLLDRVNRRESRMAGQSSMTDENIESLFEHGPDLGEEENEVNGFSFSEPPGQPVTSPRQPASNGFRSGLHVFFRNCIFYSKPEVASEPQGIIKAGKEIWLDKFDKKWHKAYTKSGVVFLSADCLQ